MARPRFIAVLLALITLLAYLPVRNFPFSVFDDPDYVTQNRIVQQGLTADGVKWAFTTLHASNWHPLTWLSHMFDCQLFGLNPGAQHFVNVLFHAANVVLLFLLLWRMTRRIWPSAFVAALFAWHPLHVESVAWISERKDVLSTFFGLLALLAYVRFAEESKAQSPKSKVWYGCALGLFALGLMAKPMLVTLPFVMLLLDFWPLGRIPNPKSKTPNNPFSVPFHLILEKIPFFALTLASCVLTYLAQHGEAVWSLSQRPFALRLGNAAVAYVLYLWKMIWPENLAVFYPLPNQIPSWHIAAAAIALAVISAFVWRARRRNPALLVGWLWFLGTLVPVIGLVQVGGQAMADRYTYLPLVGIFIALVFGAADWIAKKNLKPALPASLAGLLLAGLLLGTERQLNFWRDSETLFAHALAITKDNDVAETNLGVALEQAGQPQLALAHYLKASGINSNQVYLQNNLANLLANLGRRDEAFAHYQEALRLKPDAPQVHENFGTLLVEMGRYNEALYQYIEAARLTPNDPRPFYLMGKADLRSGDSAQAVAHFRDALQLDPNDTQTLIFLARVLASDENPAIRNGAEAVKLAERANELSGGQLPSALDTLAMAYAETRRFDDARRTIQEAIRLARANDTNADVAALQQHLKLFELNQPYREPR